MWWIISMIIALNLFRCSTADKVTCYRCHNETDLTECHRKAVICYGVCYSHNVSAAPGVTLYTKGCDNLCYSPREYKHTLGLKNAPVQYRCCDEHDYCNGDIPRAAVAMSLTESMSTAAAVVFVIVTLLVFTAGIFKRSRFKQTVQQQRRRQIARNIAFNNNETVDPDFRYVPEPPKYEADDKDPLPSYAQAVELKPISTSASDSSTVSSSRSSTDNLSSVYCVPIDHEPNHAEDFPVPYEAAPPTYTVQMVEDVAAAGCPPYASTHTSDTDPVLAGAFPHLGTTDIMIDDQTLPLDNGSLDEHNDSLPSTQL